MFFTPVAIDRQSIFVGFDTTKYLKLARIIRIPPLVCLAVVSPVGETCTEWTEIFPFSQNKLFARLLLEIFVKL